MHHNRAGATRDGPIDAKLQRNGALAPKAILALLALGSLLYTISSSWMMRRAPLSDCVRAPRAFGNNARFRIPIHVSRARNPLRVSPYDVTNDLDALLSLCTLPDVDISDPQ